MKRNSKVSLLKGLNFTINLHSNEDDQIKVAFVDTVEDDFTLVARKKRKTKNVDQADILKKAPKIRCLNLTLIRLQKNSTDNPIPHHEVR